MKRFFPALFTVALASFAWLLPSSVFAQSDWDIVSFHADISVAKNSDVTVTETIVADFHIPKHGIYRDIPVKYSNRFNQHISIGLKVLGVRDEQGNSYTYELSRNGAYQRIKIGDADTTITGEHTYIIEYQANRAMRYFDDHDEFYWNVTGNNWDVPIHDATATISLPFTADDQVAMICFTGETGSTAQDCLGRYQANLVSFTAKDFLTVAVSWPKGRVTEPSLATRIGWFISDNTGVFLPLLAFILGYALWSRRGRDPRGRGIVRQYESPDKTTPSEVAYLIRQQFSPNDVSAEIIALANKGFLKIREVSKKVLLFTSTDYEVELVKDAEQASGPQRQVMKALEGEAIDHKVLISALPSDFYEEVNKIKEAVWTSVKSRGYFDRKPETVAGLYITGAIVVGMGLLAVAIFNDFRIDLVIGGILAEFILLFFAALMPKRTQKGVEAYEYAVGFRQYIAGAETERVKWEEKQNLFFDILPFAMAFGIADKWAKAFEGKLTQPPQWYTGMNAGTFSAINFSNSMNSFASSTSAHTSPPSSSSSGFGGGGSSGGGGGGGGGGSW